MLNMFEKLINEHGSSTILKERLSLFSDKYSMLEEKLKISEQKSKVLEHENNNFKTQLSQATKEIEKLKEVVESSAESSKSHKLDDIKEKILQLLFQVGEEVDLVQLCTAIARAGQAPVLQKKLTLFSFVPSCHLIKAQRNIT